MENTTMSTCHTSVEIPEEKIIENIELLYAQFLTLVNGVKSVVEHCDTQSMHDYVFYAARISVIAPHGQAYRENPTAFGSMASWLAVEQLMHPKTPDVMKALERYDTIMKPVCETLSRTLVDLVMADMRASLPEALKAYMHGHGLKIMTEVLLAQFGYDALNKYSEKLRSDFPGAVNDIGSLTLEEVLQTNLESDQFNLLVEDLLPRLRELGTPEARFISDVYCDWFLAKSEQTTFTDDSLLFID